MRAIVHSGNGFFLFAWSEKAYYFCRYMNDPEKILAQKELEQIILNLLINEPFYGRILAKSVKIIEKKCFGISLIQSNQNIAQLYVDPEFWNDQLKSNDEIQTLLLRTNVLKKQILHFIFNHDTQIHDFEKYTNFIASAELVVNQFLQEDSDDLILPKLFPRLELRPFQSLEYYYKKLSIGLNTSELTGKIDIDSNHFDFYQNWKTQLETAIDRELKWQFRKQIILDALISKASKEEFDLPRPLVEFLNHFKTENYRPVNWKQVFRLFCSSSKRTKLTNTIRRSSKRFGTFPGTSIRRQFRILVAVDTSKSIKQTEFDLFFTEINHLWKRRAEIQIVECDTIINRQYSYAGGPPKMVTGRGNTDFNEPIRFSNEVRPDALIYFTDGFGPKPRIKSTKPILWVISKKGIQTHSKAWNDLPGRKVKIG